MSLIAVPALLLLLYIRLYSVNGPASDHLNSTEIFTRWDSGTLTTQFLFRPHNEHRKALTRLVVLGLGLATRFNNPAEMYMHWALLCGAAAILWAAFLRERPMTEDWTRSLLWYAPVSALVLSSRPYEAILGEGLPTFLSLIFLLAALYLLAFRSASNIGFIGAMGCAWCTSFSLSNGLLAWPIGFLMLLGGLRVHPRRGLIVRAAIWATAGAATVLAYFHGYQDPGNHPSATFVLSHPAMAAEYFLALCGSALAPERRAARVLGAVLLILAALSGALVAKDWWRKRNGIPFGCWLLATALLTALMITLNRADFGADPIIPARYTAFTVLAPIGLYWMTVCRRGLWRSGRALTPMLTMLLVAGYVTGSVYAWGVAPWYYSTKAFQAYLVYTAKYQASPLLEWLYPNPRQARLYSADLERLRLNVFADEHVRAEDLILTADAPPYQVDLVNGRPVEALEQLFVGAQDSIVVAGWALDSQGKAPATTIFLTIDGTRDIPGHVGIYRPDLGGRVRHRALRWGGFGGSFGGFVLGPGEHTLAVKIVSADRRHAFVTPPVCRVIRR